ncbi:hypothetical protein sos41_14020 [Alphaproteobacteria bacterium SO-S41]|nr:hypothetical protein sos41_14020 [Alphaproteobacteria bacterium SO-S41]
MTDDSQWEADNLSETPKRDAADTYVRNAVAEIKTIASINPILARDIAAKLAKGCFSRLSASGDTKTAISLAADFIQGLADGLED